MPTIAVLQPLPQPALDALSKLGALVGGDLTAPATGADAAALLAQADAALITAGTPLGAAELAGVERLKWVSSIGAGLDHMDLDLCAARGFRVANTPSAPAEATADLAFGLVLAVARNIIGADHHLREGRWARGEALAVALKEGVIAGAGLDVFESEPGLNPALLTAPNTVLVPHIGSATAETRQRMFADGLTNLADLMATGR